MQPSLELLERAAWKAGEAPTSAEDKAAGNFPLNMEESILGGKEVVE